MPDRRDHARRAQLRRRCRDLQRLQRLHLALPHRRDRQLAAGRRARTPTRSTSSSAGTRCPRNKRSIRTTHRRFRPRSRAITAEASAGQGGVAPPPWSAAHPYVNLHTPAKPATATVSGNFRLTGDGASQRHPPHRARLRRHRVSGARRPDHRHPAARRRCAGGAAFRAPVLDREPARRRAAALQQRRADGEARHRGSRRQAGARRRVEFPVRSREGRHGPGRSARSARAS